MSKYDKELDTRTPEYDDAVDPKRSGRERGDGEKADRPGDRDDRGEAEEPQPGSRPSESRSGPALPR